ncbi:MAG: hypothetical protein QM757_23110 [Paludibaculum sp.]
MRGLMSDWVSGCWTGPGGSAGGDGTGGADRSEMYVEWGLLTVTGLTIDGAAATVECLVARPESLCREIAGCVRQQCHLGGEERKN